MLQSLQQSGARPAGEPKKTPTTLSPIRKNLPRIFFFLVFDSNSSPKTAFVVSSATISVLRPSQYNCTERDNQQLT